jgi:hypothetical protein
MTTTTLSSRTKERKKTTNIPVPDLGSDTVSALKVLVVVCKVVSLHLLKVDLEDLGVVEVVMRHVVENISQKGTRHDGIGLGRGKDTVSKFEERHGECNGESWWHDESQSIVMVNCV